MTERAKRRVKDWAYPTAMVAMAVGIVIEAGFLLPIVLRQSRDAAAADTASRIATAEMKACERLQVERERSNVSEARQFLILSTAVGNSHNPMEIRNNFSELARTTVYDPPTDCAAAIAHPNSYRRPASVSFSLLPDSYAQRVVLAAKDRQPQPRP